MIGDAQKVRNHIIENYIGKARATGKKSVTAVSGTIGRELRMIARHPNICQAMKGRKLEHQANVTIEILHDTDSGEGATIECRYNWR